MAALIVAAVLLGGLALLRRRRVHSTGPYVVVAVLVWLATQASGVHPTVAGVAMGLLFASYRPSEEQLKRIPAMGRSFLSAPTAERARDVVRGLSSSLPLNDRISLRLHPMVRSSTCRLKITDRVLMTDTAFAIGVIGVFYTDDVDVATLAAAAVLLGGLALLRRSRVHSVTPYIVVAVLSGWRAVHRSTWQR